jgi:phage gp36-like protein
MYITLDQLAVNPGAKELAEVATPEHLPIVDAALMYARLTGASRATWQPAELDACEQAVSRINAAITDAAGLIDGFLSVRGYLPLQQVPDILVVWCRAIVRYKLHINRLNSDDKDPVTRDYNDALKLLRLTADGKFSLGAADPVSTSSNAPEWTAGQSTFRDALRDY